MFVFDSSAFINGSRNHFLPEMLPAVWSLVETAIDDGRIVVPRQVYRELTAQEDEIAALIGRHKDAVVEPDEAIQARVGVISQSFPKQGIRNAADPFILAEAEARGFTVVTYEGTNFAGARAKRWSKSMPSICDHFGVPCCTLPKALQRLGLFLE